jgi:phospholipid/cholesterol/gamma-HCH transport system ATP-binding protein
MAYIKINNLHKSFGNNDVLLGIDFELSRGESLVVIGRSGTGKSVLIKTLIGIIKPDIGYATIEGVDFIKANRQEKENILSGCGFLFQGGALFDSLNVEENITFFVSKHTNLNKKQRRDLAAKKLYDVGLEERLLDLYPSELSGGMRKRVGLARALALSPDIMLYDEPTTGLDPITTKMVNNLIVETARNHKDRELTSVIISHDVKATLEISDYVAFLDRGTIVEYSPVSEFKNSANPLIQEFLNL